MTCVLLLGACGTAPGPQAGPGITVLAQERVHRNVPGMVEGDHLWLSEEALEEVTGFDRKPEGLCLEELCIPVPPDGSWERQQGGEVFVDLSSLATVLDQPLVREGDRVWSLGNAPLFRVSLGMGMAPDFQLPDREGRLVHLSDFRGRKVLLLTWASW